MISILKSSSSEFMARLDAYLALPSKDSDQVQSQVRDIISDVEKRVKDGFEV